MIQLGLSAFSSPTRILFGIDAHRRIASLLKENGWNRVVVLADPAIAAGGFVAAITESLRQNGIAQTVFSQIEPEPSDATVNAAFALCREAGVRALVAIGGGSTIDVAKAVGILMTSGGEIADYEGIEKYTIPPLPLLAVPTTAGTGSEVSGAAVITDTRRKVKMAIRHAAFGPAQFAILDPLALATVPAHVAAHAGIDAFVHAFESYLSKLANPFSDAVNLHAMKLIAGSIRPFVANRQDVGAALDMLAGSSLAAMSFGTTGLGNVHCMAMAIGALYPIPHGMANALCLPHAAAFNLIAKPERFAEIAAILNGSGTVQLSQREAGLAAIQALRDLCADLGVPPRLRDVGVDEDSLDELARRCFAADYNRWNPRHTTEQDFRHIFAKAL